MWTGISGRTCLRQQVRPTGGDDLLNAARPPWCAGPSSSPTFWTSHTRALLPMSLPALRPPRTDSRKLLPGAILECPGETLAQEALAASFYPCSGRGGASPASEAPTGPLTHATPGRLLQPRGSDAVQEDRARGKEGQASLVHGDLLTVNFRDSGPCIRGPLREAGSLQNGGGLMQGRWAAGRTDLNTHGGQLSLSCQGPGPPTPSGAAGCRPLGALRPA